MVNLKKCLKFVRKEAAQLEKQAAINLMKRLVSMTLCGKSSPRLFCFVALRPKSTAMVMAGRSVHLTTLFSWANYQGCPSLGGKY